MPPLEVTGRLRRGGLILVLLARYPAVDASMHDTPCSLAKIGTHDTLFAREEIAMMTMNISLPEEMKAFIEAQMAEEGYASASEYLRPLIREVQKRKAKQALEAKFREAIESGPATPMTREDWAALRREALEGLSGETIHP
jgi:antitoxin ParD1/3/4